MKLLLLLLSLGLAGCQTAAPVPALPMPVNPAPEPRPVVTASPAPINFAQEQKIRQQAQFIEALISQNDALTAKFTAVAATPPVPIVAAATPEPAPVPKPAPLSPPTQAVPAEPVLSPNAEGIIDLAAITADAKAGEPVNPFAVRTVSAEAVREVALHVSGIMSGAVPCAVINDRLVQTGESVESLTVERIEPDTVWLRYAGRRLRLPVSEKPARVRFPL